jgi:hypothetical protein
MMLDARRISRPASRVRPAHLFLAGVTAATLALTLAGCHSATSSNGAGGPLSAWPQSPFTSQHSQITKAAKSDPFPDASQPLPPLSPNVAGGK